MKKLNRKSSEGFTIIEVMIVLAIAGLIMLIVFMAVPALQRNSRNTQRKNDVSSILGAVSEYQSNHNGSLPITSGTFSGAFTGATPNLGYYKDSAKVTWTVQATANAPSVIIDPDTVKIYNNAKCDTAGSVAITLGASARSVIALYGIESSGANVGACQEM